MIRCVQLIDQVETTLVDDTPEVGLPQLCPKFEVPSECPEVAVQIQQWFINGVSIRIVFFNQPDTVCWSRWRETDEFGVSPGPLSFWQLTPQSGTGDTYSFFHDTIVASGLTEYDWYDCQFRLEPEGLDGWQEIWPLCGGWWHLQTPKKFFPPPDVPIAVDNPGGQ